MKSSARTIPIGLVFLVAAAVFSVPGRVSGEAIYIYVGNAFTSATDPFTTSDKVTVMLRLPEPLPPDLDFQDISTLPGLYLRVKAGVLNMDTEEPGVIVNSARISTASTGEIVEWNLDLINASPLAFTLTRDSVWSFPIDIACIDRTPDTPCETEPNAKAFNISTPGVWTALTGDVLDVLGSADMASD